MRYGLIGEKLGHSYSPRLHALLGDTRYTLLPVARDQLAALLTERDFDGLNVTIPYKRDVIPHCEVLGETALAVGSVNTLVKRADGSLFGDNTDADGFAKMAAAAGIHFAGRKTLVLGSGGTSLAACYEVRRDGGQAVVISRHGEVDYASLPRHADADFLVNTTPVGMFPNTDQTPVDLRLFPKLQGVLDVIYNPLRTRLLQQAEALGIPHAGGLTMLVWQGVRARELFDGHAIPPETGFQAEASLRREVSNLTLIGMPGTGKTVVARRCARALGRTAVDTDVEIERRAGMPIAEIFAQAGESAFRDLESAVVADFGRQSGLVIATGGGAVLRETNRYALRQNSVVVRITRPLENLETGGRPLSTSLVALEAMALAREPLYRACADFTVHNDRSAAACARAVLEAYDEVLHH